VSYAPMAFKEKIAVQKKEKKKTKNNNNKQTNKQKRNNAGHTYSFQIF
jgi:hypothetical protein